MAALDSFHVTDHYIQHARGNILRYSSAFDNSKLCM